MKLHWGLLFLVLIVSGCIEIQDGKVIIDYNAIKSEKSTTEPTPISLCEKNIKNDIEFKKKTAQFPFKIIYVDIKLVNNSKEAINRVETLGVLYDYTWFSSEYPDNPSYLGVGIVEITEGQHSGTRGYYYYGCDLSGKIIVSSPRMI